MATTNSPTSTKNTLWIKSSPERLYQAFTDPSALAIWLAPGNMTGKVHQFENRVGGGYQMSLYYPSSDQSNRGKTSEKEDRYFARFSELTPPKRIVEAITFDTSDPAFSGEMIMEVSLEAEKGGTKVTVEFKNIPPGIRPEDNEMGTQSALEKLAHYIGQVGKGDKVKTVTSKDGTQIAYEQQGTGPAVILVDGAMTFRSFGPNPELAKLLEPYFTVYTYDRRGRGESSDTLPYGVEREVEDLDALIRQSGGSAFVYGISSGASLVLEAAAQLGPKIKKIALYEAPYNSTPTGRQQWQEYRKNLAQALSEGRRGDAVGLFMQLVGMPENQLEGIRQSPAWPTFESIAPTLAYDAAILGGDRSTPIERAAQVKQPALVMDGGANLQMMPFMHETAIALTKTIPHARQKTLEGQTHSVNPEALAPELIEFFSGR